MDSKTDNLIRQMSLEEIISLLAGTDNWHLRGIKRLRIPAIKVTDGPCGARTVADNDPARTYSATCFPTGVAMAATWNIDLIKRTGKTIGQEARDRACSILLGPCVNIHRTPLGGRNFESFSEDPCLSAAMAVAFIQGVQGRGVGTAVKHFALNNSEYERMTISSEADERTMREIYFPSFEKAVREAKSWSVMCSYNKVNGVYASENRELLTDILKNEWGFEGPVISDWFAVHSTLPAARAGLELEMPGPARFFGEALLEAVRNGEIEESLIDAKAARILGLVLKTGKATRRLKIKAILYPANQHRELSREVAEEAMVLLKNDRNILPLDAAKTKCIAIIGPNAAKPRIEGGGSSRVEAAYEVPPLMAIQKYCGRRVKIR